MRGLALCRVDQLAQFLGEFAVSLPRLVRSKLRRHGEEAVVISVYMAAQQRDDVASGRHSSLLLVPARSSSKTDTNDQAWGCIGQKGLHLFDPVLISQDS